MYYTVNYFLNKYKMKQYSIIKVKRNFIYEISMIHFFKYKRNILNS